MRRVGKGRHFKMDGIIGVIGREEIPKPEGKNLGHRGVGEARVVLHGG